MIVFWKKKLINQGDQPITELTVLEWKRLFSIKLFKFHKAIGCQDRFHTHSFNAFSLLLKGNYVEEILRDNRVCRYDRNRRRLIFIPKLEYHRITRSEGCITLLVTGPWEAYWDELRSLGNSRYLHVICGDGRSDVKFGPVVTLDETDA